MRIILALMGLLGPFLLGALMANPAAAGALYRCTGKQGEVAFTNSRAGYKNCRLIRTFADAPTPAPKPVATGDANRPMGNVPLGATSPRHEFRKDPDPPLLTPPAQPAQIRRGAVYKYMKDGVAHYTNRPPAGQRAKVLFTYIETCFACGAAPGIDFNSLSLNTTAYASEIRNAASVHGVDEAWVRAVVHAESAFNANAISNKGAQGLMQLMPATASRFGVGDPFAAEQNIEGGTAYLSWLLKRFNGDHRLATAAYNAGEGSVDRFSGVPPFDETQRFVERVGILHQRYKGALASASAPKG